MGIALSQFVNGTANGVSSVNVLFSSAVTAANSIIVLSGTFNIGSAGLSTVLDNVNNAGYTLRMHSTMSNASDTQAHMVIHDKLNISSGAAASTYRVSFNAIGGFLGGLSMCATEWSGGPFTAASTVSANGTSTGPQAGALTASSTPVLFFSGATVNSTTTFNSTVGAGGPHVYITTVDPTNANCVLNAIYSVNSSLQQNPMHSLTTSTRWLAGTVLYLGAGGGGAATAVSNPWVMCLSGIQDKVY